MLFCGDFGMGSAVREDEEWTWHCETRMRRILALLALRKGLQDLYGRDGGSVEFCLILCEYYIDNVHVGLLGIM